MKKQFKLILTFWMVFGAGYIFAQSVTINGKVTEDVTNEPLFGVTVLIGGTEVGSTTDFDGNYSIEAKDTKGKNLMFSYIGYESTSVALSGDNQTINVSLKQSATQLDEVVVTALGIKREQKALGYSLTKVGGDDLTQVKTTSAVNALQGRVAGVNISTNSSGASGSSRVIIRGASSMTGNNQPLYVIDGIPTINTTKASVGAEDGHFGDGGDDISDINSNDIESVSVLKGAAAAALYGALASNGVVMITTKSGKKGKDLGVEYSGSVTFQRVDMSLIDELQTTYGQGRSGLKPGYAWEMDANGDLVGQVQIVGSSAQIQDAFDNTLLSWGAEFDGSDVYSWQNAYVTDGVIKDKIPYEYIGNNMEKFYNDASTVINSLALTKGGDNYSYRISASLLGNNDLMPNTTLDRQSFSFNGKANINPKLTSSLNAKYVIENVHNRVGIGTWPGNANYTAMLLPGGLDITDMQPGSIPENTEFHDGGARETGIEMRFQPSDFTQNPYWVANSFNNDDKKNRITASSSLRYDFTDWLYASVRSGIDSYSFIQKQVIPYGTGFSSKGEISMANKLVSLFNTDVMMGIDKELINKISTNSTIGGSSRKNKIEALYSTGSNFVIVGLEHINNTESKDTYPGYSEMQTNSLYGSFEFDYDKFIYLTYTGRNDWFSTLSYPGKETPNNEYYQSLSSSILLNKAFNLPESIDFLKLRGSYAQVAGGSEYPYELSQGYSIYDSHLGNPFGGVSGSSVPNLYLVPFQKDEFEVGLDGRFLRSRAYFDVAYYKNETSKDIVKTVAAPSSGYSHAIVNSGKTNNNGLEFLIGGRPIENDNFNWSTSFNMSYNKSEITYTNEKATSIDLAESRTHTAFIRQEVGEPFGAIFGYEYLRDDDGNIMYDTTNPNLPKPMQGDLVRLGVGVAPLNLGFSNSFSYKNLNLHFLIDGKFGGQMFSGTNAYAYNTGAHTNTLEGREDGLTVTGVDENGDDLTSDNNTVRKDLLRQYYGHIVNSIAEEFIRDTDFIKFRELSLGYNFPEKTLKSIFIQDLKLSLTGRNLFFIMKKVENVDPEASLNNTNAQGFERFGVPSSKSLGFSINIKF